MKAILRHKPLLRPVHFYLRSWMKRKFDTHLEQIKPATRPCIILCNHTSNYDPILLGTQFPELLYFVASDHLFRLGLTSRLLIALAGPIPRLKSSTDVQTAKQILAKLREGGSVGLFAEGNNTFSGVTGEIPESTGKLVKRSGAGLITYRIDGAYFSNPRWGKHCRKGKVTGRVVGEYSPDQLAQLSVEEINLRIQQDLFVDAYEEQKQSMQSYLGEALAESLELALYLCPSCGRIDSLRSRGDRFFCECGLDQRYCAHGFLEAAEQDQAPFDTVRDWFFWQRQELSAQIHRRMGEGSTDLNADAPLFADENQTLYRIDKADSVTKIGTGTLQFHQDRLELVRKNTIGDTGDRSESILFPLEEIQNMSIYEKMVLIFTTADHETYEVKSDHLRNAVKYVDAYRELTLSPEVPS